MTCAKIRGSGKSRILTVSTSDNAFILNFFLEISNYTKCMLWQKKCMFIYLKHLFTVCFIIHTCEYLLIVFLLYAENRYIFFYSQFFISENFKI
jgi:hypothetical protein